VLVQTLGKLEPVTLAQHGAALVAGLEHLCLQGSGFRRWSGVYSFRR
jgi:hypothetical protein